MLLALLLRCHECQKWTRNTIELDLIATEILAFPYKLSRNKNDSDPINEKTTPI